MRGIGTAGLKVAPCLYLVLATVECCCEDIADKGIDVLGCRLDTCIDDESGFVGMTGIATQLQRIGSTSDVADGITVAALCNDLDMADTQLLGIDG